MKIHLKTIAALFEKQSQWSKFSLAFVLTLMSCSSKLIIQSEPPEAVVYLSMNGKKDKIKVGQTPIELSEKQIADYLQLSPQRTDMIEISLEKKDFENIKMLVPSNRWGESVKTVKVGLQSRTEPGTIVTTMLRHLFNAKKFAETRQYDQAHSAIDSALQLDSTLAAAMTMKGSIYFLQDKISDAQEWYKKALAADPAQSEAIQMLQKIKTKTGGT